MIKRFLDDVMEFMMDYVMPVLLIGAFSALGVLIMDAIFNFDKPTLEQTVETCILEQREEEPECKFAILKYTRKQNQTTVMPVPIVIPNK